MIQEFFENAKMLLRSLHSHLNRKVAHDVRKFHKYKVSNNSLFDDSSSTRLLFWSSSYTSLLLFLFFLYLFARIIMSDISSIKSDAIISNDLNENISSINSDAIVSNDSDENISNIKSDAINSNDSDENSVDSNSLSKSFTKAIDLSILNSLSLDLYLIEVLKKKLRVLKKDRDSRYFKLRALRVERFVHKNFVARLQRRIDVNRKQLTQSITNEQTIKTLHDKLDVCKENLVRMITKQQRIITLDDFCKDKEKKLRNKIDEMMQKMQTRLREKKNALKRKSRFFHRRSIVW